MVAKYLLGGYRRVTLWIGTCMGTGLPLFIMGLKPETCSWGEREMVSELISGDPSVIGRYRLFGRLGAGDMGQVFLGQSSAGGLVAIKAIRAELADEPGFRERFAHEVTAARNVGGLFTARVVDADPDALVPWVATAYVAGPSLAEAVTEHGPLPSPSVARLAAGLAEGLAAIHVSGVVHRDLKPANVLLAQDGPRVVDFGISRAVDTILLTKTGMVMGSPGFMSPEQVNAEEARPPSDIFALGAVLTFAATGEGPFGTGPTPALAYRVLAREPDLTRVPEELRALVRRCLSKDPAQRPTAEDALAELGAGRLAAGWLPGPVAAMLPRYAGPARDAGHVSPGTGKPAATGPAETAAAARLGGGRPRGPRRRWWVAAAAGAVFLAAAGGTAFALSTSEPGQHLVAEPLAGGPTQAGSNTGSQAGAAVTASMPARTAAAKHAARRAPRPPRSSALRPWPRPTPAPVAARPTQAGPTLASPAVIAQPTRASSAPSAKPVQPTRPARPATGVVPGVTGDTLSAAESALRAAGLDNYSGLYGCYGSPGLDDVVTQAPVAGTRIALTASVRLDLQAEDCVTMPDVAGLRLTKAESTLYALGFEPADITSRFECDGPHPANQVETQSPAAGTSYPNDQPVSLGVAADDCR